LEGLVAQRLRQVDPRHLGADYRRQLANGNHFIGHGWTAPLLTHCASWQSSRRFLSRAGIHTDICTGLMKIAIVGASAYFARQRTPRTHDDLARQSCIQCRLAVGGGPLVWTLAWSGKIRRISVD